MFFNKKEPAKTKKVKLRALAVDDKKISSTELRNKILRQEPLSKDEKAFLKKAKNAELLKAYKAIAKDNETTTRTTKTAKTATTARDRKLKNEIEADYNRQIAQEKREKEDKEKELAQDEAEHKILRDEQRQKREQAKEKREIKQKAQDELSKEIATLTTKEINNLLGNENKKRGEFEALKNKQIKELRSEYDKLRVNFRAELQKFKDNQVRDYKNEMIKRAKKEVLAYKKNDKNITKTIRLSSDSIALINATAKEHKLNFSSALRLIILSHKP